MFWKWGSQFGLLPPKVFCLGHCGALSPAAVMWGALLASSGQVRLVLDQLWP